MNLGSQGEAQNPSDLLWSVHCLFKLVFPYQRGIGAKAGSQVKKEIGLVERNPPASAGGSMDGEGAGGTPLVGTKSRVMNGGSESLLLPLERPLTSAVTGRRAPF